jgi:hypothetical protein
MSEREQMVYKDLQYAIFFLDVFILFVHVLRLYMLISVAYCGRLQAQNDCRTLDWCD